MVLDLSLSGTAAPQKQAPSSAGVTRGGGANNRASVAASTTAANNKTRNGGVGVAKRTSAPGSSSATGTFSRPAEWTPEIEDLWRLQASGWTGIEEYTATYGVPQRWAKADCPHQFISKLQLKQNGFFVYWRKDRECSQQDLKRVKITAC